MRNPISKPKAEGLLRKTPVWTSGLHSMYMYMHRNFSLYTLIISGICYSNRDPAEQLCVYQMSGAFLVKELSLTRVSQRCVAQSIPLPILSPSRPTEMKKQSFRQWGHASLLKAPGKHLRIFNIHSRKKRINQRVERERRGLF